LSKSITEKKIQQRNRAVKYGKICIEILLAVEKIGRIANGPISSHTLHGVVSAVNGRNSEYINDKVKA